ncbi:ribonuclease HI family protein [Lacticaseibacillus kribbianus]|uniref:ribonuclease HI family protein n=1 Tax=Lacticaseibacillus kribbianus TaxID=2926292 RepID=UPI001CD7D3E3|nr:ribonuclease HI family protein [Lacticaseibacillus kribbianus]
MLKLYTDAATRGNPGPSGIGILAVEGGRADQYHQALGVMSNHDAEFQAVIIGLTRLIGQRRTKAVTLYSDSKIVIDALDKRYAKHYGDDVAQLEALVPKFGLLLWQWVPDRQNHAHALAQQGLRLAVQQADFE